MRDFNVRRTGWKARHNDKRREALMVVIQTLDLMICNKRHFKFLKLKI